MSRRWLLLGMMLLLVVPAWGLAQHGGEDGHGHAQEEHADHGDEKHPQDGAHGGGGIDGPRGDEHGDAHGAAGHGDHGDHGDGHGDGHGGGHHERVIAPELHPEAVTGGFWPPALFLLIGALALPLLPKLLRAVVAIVVPAVTLWYVWTQLPDGARVTYEFLEQTLILVRADRLSLVFGSIFSLIGVIAGIYAWKTDDRRQQVSAMLYNAGALGVTFAGDFLTLYAFWELMAVASTILIWARGGEESERAGNRYILTHLAGGAVLLVGILMHWSQTGSLEFVRFAAEGAGAAAWFILIGFALNAAVPPLGPWLPDAYPKATVTGAIFLSALTTKTAVYTLLRGFAGWDVLLVAGVVMALYGVVYAVLANDIRELLAYHIISQVGYMVAGAGLGTEMAINGATAHAVSHILYKALLFMGAGVVLYTTGQSKLTQLGGFWKRQKLVFGLYMIGAFSISGFPLWNGFISKSMVVAAAGEDHVQWAFLLLMLASVGTFLHTGLKLPYFTWMGEDRGIQPKPAPVNMVIAMAIAAFCCTALGWSPGMDVLYERLPYVVTWSPWTTPHVMEAVQMLVFTFFAFYLFIPGLHGYPTVSMDTDVVYRKPAPVFRAVFVTAVGWVFDESQRQRSGWLGLLLGG